MKRILFGLYVLMLLAGCSTLKDLQEYNIYDGLNTVTPTSVSVVVSKEAPSPILVSTAVVICKVRTNVEEGNLNLRSGAGTSYVVLEVLSEGELLTLTGKAENGWIEVIRADKQVGWVNFTLIKC